MNTQPAPMSSACDGRQLRHRQAGQSMVEALVACALVLVPLFLAIPVVAKYIDLRSSTVQAARYAAWERTVWFGGDAAEPMGLTGSNQWKANEKTDNQIRAELGARLLSRRSTLPKFQSGDASSSSFADGTPQFWVDRRGTALLASYSGVGNQIDNAQSPGITNDILEPVLTLTELVSSFTLETKARYTAQVALSVQEVAFNTDKGLGLCPGCSVDFIATGNTLSFQEKNVVVANGWSANGPGSYDDWAAGDDRLSVYSQVRGLTPGSVLKPENGVFKTIMEVLNGLALVFFPELSTLDFGRIEVDRVPADRKGP